MEVWGFATPWFDRLFRKWPETFDDQILRCLLEPGQPDVIEPAKPLAMSEQSAACLIADISGKGKVRVRFKARDGWDGRVSSISSTTVQDRL